MDRKSTRVVVVDDDALFRTTVCDFLAPDGLRLSQAGTVAQARMLLDEETSVVLLDHKLPDGVGLDLARDLSESQHRHRILMVSGQPGIADAADALQWRIDDFLEKPVSLERLRLAVFRALESVRLQRAERKVRRQQARALRSAHLVGRSLEDVRSVIQTAATARCAVLITGETGSGKGLVAASIHHASDASSELVQVNCAALPSTLVEAELFGVAKGAYTSADRDRPGLFERAADGTLFLDEIGELAPEVQAKLLGALENGTIRRVGDIAERPTHVRVIAATNADLEAAVAQGRFRNDLYFRLAVLTIRLPPLRARLGDLPELVAHILGEVAPHVKARLAPGELERLLQYRWPGNVRELRNVLERATLLHPVTKLRPSTFLRAGAGAGSDPSLALGDEIAEGDEDHALSLTLDEVCTRHIAKVLRACDDNRTLAAQRLGIGLSTLRRKINQP